MGPAARARVQPRVGPERLQAAVPGSAEVFVALLQLVAFALWPRIILYPGLVVRILVEAVPERCALERGESFETLGPAFNKR